MLTKFYPNPLVNTKTVYFNSSKGNIQTITITDLTGRIVDTFNVNASQGRYLKSSGLSCFTNDRYFNTTDITQTNR